MNKLIRRFEILFLLAATAISISGQSDANLSLPEYYGIYAILNGKACSMTTLDAPGCKFPRTTIETDQKGSPILLDKTKGLRLLIYQENASASTQYLELRPMVFLRNVTTNILSTSSRTDPANSWRYINPTDTMLVLNVGEMGERIRPIPFLVKPFKANSVIVVPSKTLEDGVYQLRWPSSQGTVGVLFSVGDRKAAERKWCVDLDTFPPINERYVTCSETDSSTSAKANANQAPPSQESMFMPDSKETITVPAKPMSGAVPTRSAPKEATPKKEPSMLDELVRISTEFNEARSNGDRSKLDMLLSPDFKHYEKRFNYTSKRDKFINDAAKKWTSEFSCRGYSLSKGPFNEPILNFSCSFKQQQIGGIGSQSGTFTAMFVSFNNSWRISRIDENTLPR